MAVLTEALKELTADRDLESKVVLCPRLEHFVGLAYSKTTKRVRKNEMREQVRHGEKWGGEMGPTMLG